MIGAHVDGPGWLDLHARGVGRVVRLDGGVACAEWATASQQPALSKTRTLQRPLLRWSPRRVNSIQQMQMRFPLSLSHRCKHRTASVCVCERERESPPRPAPTTRRAQGRPRGLRRRRRSRPEGIQRKIDARDSNRRTSAPKVPSRARPTRSACATPPRPRLPSTRAAPRGPQRRARTKGTVSDALVRDVSDDPSSSL